MNKAQSETMRLLRGISSSQITSHILPNRAYITTTPPVDKQKYLLS